MGEAVSIDRKRDSLRRRPGLVIFASSLVLSGAGLLLSYFSYRWHLAGFDPASARMALAGLGLALIFAGLVFVSGFGAFRLFRKKGGAAWTAAGVLVSAGFAAGMLVLALR